MTVDLDKVMVEVQNEIRRAYKIWETKDINSVKEIYADNIVVFGTDESEYWKGIDEFEATLKVQMTAINDPIFDFKNETIHISPSGDMASYSHKFDITFTSKGGTENLEDFKKERFGKFYTKWYFWLLILLIIAFLVNFL